MQKIFILFPIVFVLIGCAAPKTTKTTPQETVMYPVNELYEVTSRGIKQGSKFVVTKSDRELSISYLATNTTWKLSTSLQGFPVLEAVNSPLIAALYNMALEEAIKDIRPDKTFMAGEKWNGVWTRDISYSIHLALALLFPEISEKSLFTKVDTNQQVIIQDTGTGGSWPISSDRVVWSLAASEYLFWNNNPPFLKRAYEVMKNTAIADRHAVYDSRTGLYHGESSFMDWREQSYASWMSPADIYESFSFSTCVLHYNHLQTLSSMALQLGLPQEAKQWKEWADNLAKAIRSNFFSKELNTYASYIYPFPINQVALKTDNLGLALAVLTGVVPTSEKAQIVQSIPVVPFGVVCLWPQQPHAGYYHNKGIWPFVNAYYVLAAKETGNLEAISFGIKSIIRAAGFFGTHKENFSYDRGHTDKMAVNSDRQLWSVAGYLAMVYKVLFGITPTEKGLTFRPFVPSFVEGPLVLKNLRYRNAIFTITINGTGDTIESMQVNDSPVSPDMVFSGETNTLYTITISLKQSRSPQSIRLVSVDDVSLSEPKAKLSNTMLTWKPVKNAQSYTVFFNNTILTQTTETSLNVPSQPGVLTVQARKETLLHSCLSSPVWILPDNLHITIQPELSPALQAFATNRYKGFTGEGYILLDNEGSITPEVPLAIPETGSYLIRFRYANGNGPINTDNRCGIRTLLIDGKEIGVVVFPQRGTWTEWGYSSSLVAKLKAGKHTLKLIKHPLDNNMNGKINQAAIDTVELIRWGKE